MQNAALARVFSEIADMLEIKEESIFRISAYRRAARALDALSEDVAAVAARGELTEIPGVGASTAQKIEEFLTTGTIGYYEELRASLPAGLTRLMTVPEVGPKTALLLHERLGIASIEELEEACRAGRVRALPRMGAKTEENILRGIEQMRRRAERLPLGQVLPHAKAIEQALRALPEVKAVSLAGSLRRMRETIGDIDLLATARRPEKVMEVFTTLPQVRRVLARGPTKSSVVLEVGVQADLRVVDPKSFGAALQYFTGSKEHNVKLREKAVRRGLKINEYGVFRVKDERRVAGGSEEEVYAALDLPWIPPEIREDQGEVELAERGALPRLIALGDIRGDLQMHTRWSDGSDSAEQMAKAAKALGYQYIAITDHSQSLKFAGGVTIEELRAHAREVKRVGERVGIAVLIGTECEVAPDGRLDYPDEVLAELDIVLAAVHSHFRMSEEEMTRRLVRAMESPHVHLVAHPTGRLLSQRESYAVNVETLIETARRTGTALEINAGPERLDLRDSQARLARERGVRLAINTDAHTRDELRYMEFGIGTARRGWVQPADVLNSLPLEALRVALRKRAGAGAPQDGPAGRPRRSRKPRPRIAAASTARRKRR
ncbi:MAG: DNA polymerase/3'-5' exonuclease PolX [Armatimonadetes bacterium]|nr:DNA polymerase/3'-5' exonuclease PolX [Armatimonadota bacterium]